MSLETTTLKKTILRTGLWRTAPRQNPIKAGKESFPFHFVFPSGRQTLSRAIQLAGLGRMHRVAFPEWSSHCVVSAIARYATPVPFTESMKFRAKPDAVLIYEQWGWPIATEAMEQIKSYAEDMVFIFDMVDSAHFKVEVEEEKEPDGFTSFFRFTSLSKLLGLSGGGIGIANERYMGFSPDTESERLLAFFEKQNVPNEFTNDFFKNIMKENMVAIPAMLLEWLEKNDLRGAIADELAARQANLKKIMSSSLTDEWPHWMKDAARNGAGPGIAPLLRGASEKILKRIKASLLDVHNVETEIYHFNWSGNPLEASYEKCLAFPVHGMVRNIENILSDLEAWEGC
ncbi:MAG: hypothetical protein ABFD82_06015 [Syntrophaceae bacterium]